MGCAASWRRPHALFSCTFAPSKHPGTNYVSAINTHRRCGVTASNVPYFGVPLLTRRMSSTFSNQSIVRTSVLFNALQPGQAARAHMNEVLGVSTGAMNLCFSFSSTMRHPSTPTRRGASIWKLENTNSRSTVSGRRHISTSGPPYAGLFGSPVLCDLIRTTGPASIRRRGTIIHEALHTQMIGDYSRWYQPANRETCIGSV